MKTELILAASLAATPALGQQGAFTDLLVDRLAGKWVLTGRMDKGEVTHDISAEWVLAHQYLELHEVSRAKNADGLPDYQATGYIGWDAGKKIYDCVWLDDYGSISTQFLGYAKPDGDRIAFVFQDRDDKGSFHTTFTWHPKDASWSMDMDQVSNGRSEVFARTVLTAAR